MIVVAVVGMPGARKTDLATELEGLGYVRITLSKYITADLERSGKPLIPPEYWRAAQTLRASSGAAILAQRALEELSTQTTTLAVIDGLRCLPELRVICERTERLLLVGVHSDPALRRRRLISSSHGYYAANPDGIVELDALEIALGVGSLCALADLVVSVPREPDADLSSFFSDAANFLHNIVTRTNEDDTAHRRDYLKALSSFIETKPRCFDTQGRV